MLSRVLDGCVPIVVSILKCIMNTLNEVNQWVRHSVTLRAMVVGVLALLLLIPVAMVRSVIDERQANREAAVANIEQTWGGKQILAGPVLSVPYILSQQNDTGERVSTTAYLYFLPKELSVDGTIAPEIRSRGMFEAAVYSSEVTFSGAFESLNPNVLGVDPSAIRWNEATLSVGVPDLRGIQKEVSVAWDAATLSLAPGVPTNDVLRPVNTMPVSSISHENALKPTSAGGRTSALSVRIPLNISAVQAPHTFSFKLALNGSQALQVVPLGETTDVHITSSWKTPSFSGAFLPDEREVTDKGFSASWHVLNLNREFPQSWVGNIYDVYGSAFGVDFMVPVDEYQKSTRSAKYALLIIALTFLVFFSVETFNKKRIHPIQYVLVGLALVMFYTLLVALSEVVGFNNAYLASSVATIGLIVMYSRAVLQNKKAVRVQGSVLVFLYLFVYTILQLEDYAFLAGSIGLFIILSVIMYLSRRVDWYGVNK